MEQRQLFSVDLGGDKPTLVQIDFDRLELQLTAQLLRSGFRDEEVKTFLLGHDVDLEAIRRRDRMAHTIVVLGDDERVHQSLARSLARQLSEFPALLEGEHVDVSPKAVAERRKTAIFGKKKGRWG